MAPAPVTVIDTQYVLTKIYFYVNVYLNLFAYLLFSFARLVPLRGQGLSDHPLCVTSL